MQYMIKFENNSEGDVIVYYYKRLRDLREDHDLLQKQIADVLHITREQYQLYESGKREIKVHQLLQLADYYQVSVDYLLERTDNPEINQSTSSNQLLK